MLGLGQFYGFLGELRVSQQRGIASAADFPAAAVVEAVELWPRAQAADPVERVNAEDFLKVALDVIPPLVYESEDSSDFPGVSDPWPK